jgi:hypothetical protein
MYVQEMQSKTELEKILRRCVDDIKEEILQMRGEGRVFGKCKPWGYLSGKRNSRRTSLRSRSGIS